MRSRWNAVACGAALVSAIATNARAENTDTGASDRAAGWVIVGVGSALGLGTATSGGVLLASGRSAVEEVGVASLAGGAVTLLTSLIIGIPLLSSGDSKKREQALDALSGRFRF